MYSSPAAIVIGRICPGTLDEKDTTPPWGPAWKLLEKIVAPPAARFTAPQTPELPPVNAVDVVIVTSADIHDIRPDSPTTLSFPASTHSRTCNVVP
jgi:hypothetical protein